MAVSFIQSLFDGFGSGIVAPGTGVVLQNRGACFAVSGAVEPGRRPYHTIIPGMLLRDGELLGPFGVMGGFIQAQAHMQLVSAMVDDGLDPQAALDRPRFRVDGERVRLEEGLWDHEADLQRLGYQTVRETDTLRLRRRPGDPRLGRRAGRRLRPAQGRLRRRYLAPEADASPALIDSLGGSLPVSTAGALGTKSCRRIPATASQLHAAQCASSTL